MWKFLRIVILLPAALLPLLGDSNSPALSQEHQGCFLVDSVGNLIDLSDICPTPEPFVVATPPAAPSPEGEPELGTGDIQVTLRWATTDDLDLSVTDPAGETVAYFNPAISSGGQLDVDANAGCAEQDSTPIENIFWPPSEAPQGEYSISVNLFARCQGEGSVSFNLTLLVQGTTQTLTGTVDEQNPIATFPFSLPQ